MRRSREQQVCAECREEAYRQQHPAGRAEHRHQRRRGRPELADTPVPDALRGKVQFSGRTPKEVLDDLARQNARRVYLDGGQVIQSFLREGLVADMVITTVPVLLGSGKSLFGALTGDIDLTLVSSRSFPSGLVQSHYRVTP